MKISEISEALSAELSGAGVTTWTERLLPAQELFDLVINDGRDGEGRWLPLAEGIVQLSFGGF